MKNRDTLAEAFTSKYPEGKARTISGRQPDNPKCCPSTLVALLGDPGAVGTGPRRGLKIYHAHTSMYYVDVHLYSRDRTRTRIGSRFSWRSRGRICSRCWLPPRQMGISNGRVSSIATPSRWPKEPKVPNPQSPATTITWPNANANANPNPNPNPDPEPHCPASTLTNLPTPRREEGLTEDCTALRESPHLSHDV